MIDNFSIYGGLIASIALLMLGIVLFRLKKGGNKNEISQSALDEQLNASLETIRQSITLFPLKK